MSKVLHITTADFDNVVASKVPVLVDFWAPWCGPCRMLTPILDEISIEVGDTAVVAKVNIDDESEIATRFGIMSIPTMMVFKEGKAIKTQVGFVPKEKILELLK